jgi:hypothetical protein
MLAKLTRLGISCGATPSQLRSAREHFEQHNYLRLPGFIEPGLLRVIDITAVPYRFARGPAAYARQFQTLVSATRSFSVLLSISNTA